MSSLPTSKYVVRCVQLDKLCQWPQANSEVLRGTKEEAFKLALHLAKLHPNTDYRIELEPEEQLTAEGLVGSCDLWK